MSTEAITGFARAGTSMLHAFSAVAAGNAAAGTEKANAEAQAGVMEANAAATRREAAAKEAMVRRQGRAVIGKQRAAMAQAGIAGAGTALNVEEQSLIDAELDALTVRYNGMNQAESLLHAARNTRAAGRNRAAALRGQARLGAAGYLAGSAAALYGVYAGARDTHKSE